MYAFIRGKLAYSSPSNIIIDCNGVGYSLMVPPTVYTQLPSEGNEITLYTSFVVREQLQALYGFLCPEEKKLFERLLDVSGIGPKTALSIIGHLPLPHFEEAVRMGDVNAISKVPGIGKKTAQRLLIDMKDKLSIKSGSRPSDWQIGMGGDSRSKTIEDAISALINLGYNRPAAEKAIEKTLGKSKGEIELAALITASLKNV